MPHSETRCDSGRPSPISHRALLQAGALRPPVTQCHRSLEASPSGRTAEETGSGLLRGGAGPPGGLVAVDGLGRSGESDHRGVQKLRDRGAPTRNKLACGSDLSGRVQAVGHTGGLRPLVGKTLLGRYPLCRPDRCLRRSGVRWPTWRRPRMECAVWLRCGPSPRLSGPRGPGCGRWRQPAPAGLGPGPAPGGSAGGPGARPARG